MNLRGRVSDLAALFLFVALFIAANNALAGWSEFFDCAWKKLKDLLAIGAITVIASSIFNIAAGEVISEAAEAAVKKALKELAKKIAAKIIPWIGMIMLILQLLWLLLDCFPHLAGFNGIEDLAKKIYDALGG